jgi:hypothetical protein
MFVPLYKSTQCTTQKIKIILVNATVLSQIRPQLCRSHQGSVYYQSEFLNPLYQNATSATHILNTSTELCGYKAHLANAKRWSRERKTESEWDISGSHSGECEDDSLLGYSAMWSHRSRSMFQRCILPPSSGQSLWSTSMRLDNATSLKAVIFRKWVRCISHHSLMYCQVLLSPSSVTGIKEIQTLEQDWAQPQTSAWLFTFNKYRNISTHSIIMLRRLV